MSDVLKILYMICFILAAVSFCTAIFIFFKFRIVEVIQDLNGTIARRQIEIMRERNEHAKNYGAGLLDAELGKTGKTGRTGLTGRTGRTGKTVPKSSGPITISSLQNQSASTGWVQNGTTVLQSNKIINSDFVIIKNIVFINTSESI